MRVILAGAAVVVLVAGIFLMRPDPVAQADDKACDLLTSMVSRGTPSGQVAIVEIDESSLAQLGRWPWPRNLLALVVRRLFERGAATVVLDMMLHEEDSAAPSPLAGREKVADGSTNDQVLSATISGNPVVIGYAFQFDGARSRSACAVNPLPLAVVGPNDSWTTGFFHPSGALCSVPQLSQAAAASGFLNAAPDTDGKLRRVPLVIESGDRQYSSLALAALSVYRRTSSMQLTLNAREASQLRIGTQVVRLEGPSCLRLRFRGAGRSFPYIPVNSVLDDRISLPALQGKIAIVGGSALGLPHPVATPLDSQFSDLEVEATAIDNLLQGDSFNRPAGFHMGELLLALVGGLGSTWLLARIRSWWSACVVLAAAVAVWAACTLLLSTTGLLFSPLPATAALVCPFPVVALLNYVTEKKRAEQAHRELASAEEQTRVVMRESEDRYQKLVENVNDAIIVDDTAGRLVFANRRFREWFGLADRDIREIVLEDYVAPEWRSTMREQHDRRMKGAAVSGNCEYEGIHPDGGRIWIEALVTNLEEDGRIVGTQAALRDVTERKRIEAQYLQAQKMEGIGRMAGSVAHDFNNLLTVINGYSDLLLKRRLDENQVRTDLQAIRAAGERAAELTRNLLAFSRKQLVQLRVLNPNTIVAEAEKMYGRLIGEDIELVTHLAPELGHVMADSGQIHQILMNLLVNARDAMPRGGVIVIETRNVEAGEDFLRSHPGFTAGSFVCLTVTDTGAGMTHEVKRHLFEPFFTTKDMGRGTGLGLATVDGIVRQNGGQIEVVSTLGEGATFHIYLPRVQTTEAVQPGVHDRAAVWKGSETVLVVEDQDAVRQYVRTVLEHCGHRVLEASNGPNAIALAEQFPDTIHLLVTDVVLPIMNGRELAAKLKATRPRMKVLFTSGYSEETIGSRGIISTDLAYLQKPFTPEGLLAKVREALASPESTGRTMGSTGA